MLAAITIVVVAGVGALFAILPPVAAQAGPSATRSFDTDTVAPGGVVVVTIMAADYGGFGRVTETLPAGFAYVSTDLDDTQVTDNTGTNREVGFTLQGDSSFTYTVTASSVEDVYTFSGSLRDSDRMDTPVGGDSMVTVEAPPVPQASATRSFDTDTVAPGGVVVVTIMAANYGGFGRVTEMLPAGFAYVSSNLQDENEQVLATGQEVRFTLQQEDSFTYTVTASSVEDVYTFSGSLRDSDRMDTPMSAVIPW